MKAHSQIINCIDGVGGLGIGEGAPEIVTGSRDGMHSQLVTLSDVHVHEASLHVSKYKNMYIEDLLAMPIANPFRSRQSIELQVLYRRSNNTN